jgi:hypothetical protein
MCLSLQLQLLQHPAAACAAGQVLLLVLLGAPMQQQCQTPAGLAGWQQRRQQNCGPMQPGMVLLCDAQRCCQLPVLPVLLLLLLVHAGSAPLQLQPLQQQHPLVLLLLLLLGVCCHALCQHPAVAPVHCLLCWLLCCSTLQQHLADACHLQLPGQPEQHLLRLLHLQQNQALTLLLLVLPLPLPLLLLRWPGCWCWTLLGGPCWQG